MSRRPPTDMDAAQIINSAAISRATRRSFLKGASAASLSVALARMPKARGRMGRGGVGSGPAFAPNYNSSSAGTSMTSPWTADRQFVPADGGYTAAGVLRSGGASINNTGTGSGGTGSGNYDSYLWPWFAGDYTQPPIIDIPSAIASLTGQNFPAPPDNNPTIMAIKWPAWKTDGLAPFTTGTPVGNMTQAQKMYFCCYVFPPSNFTTNGNSIKWWQFLQDASGANSANDLLMLYTADAGVLKGPCAVLQNDINAIYAATDTLALNIWSCVEYYLQMESPWGAANGVVKIWVNGVLVFSSNSVTFVNGYAVSSLSNGTTTTVVLSQPATTFTNGPNLIALQGVNPTNFNTTGRTKGSSIASWTDDEHFTLNLDSSGFPSYVSGGVATRMGGGGFLQSGLKPYLGGGGGVGTNFSGQGTLVSGSTTLTITQTTSGSLTFGSVLGGTLAANLPASTHIVQSLGGGQYQMSAAATATVSTATSVTGSIASATIDTYLGVGRVFCAYSNS